MELMATKIGFKSAYCDVLFFKSQVTTGLSSAQVLIYHIGDYFTVNV